MPAKKVYVRKRRFHLVVEATVRSPDRIGFRHDSHLSRTLRSWLTQTLLSEPSLMESADGTRAEVTGVTLARRDPPAAQPKQDLQQTWQPCMHHNNDWRLTGDATNEWTGAIIGEGGDEVLDLTEVASGCGFHVAYALAVELCKVHNGKPRPPSENDAAPA